MYLFSKWDVVHIAIYHKIGEVPIGQTSVIIAISSVHRSVSGNFSQKLLCLKSIDYNHAYL